MTSRNKRKQRAVFISLMMNIFLEQVSDDFTNFFVLMLVDQAGWHKSMELKVYFDFDNCRRKHQGLDGRTPDEVYCTALRRD